MTNPYGHVEDYYAVLGLSAEVRSHCVSCVQVPPSYSPPQATRPEIKAAYRELAKQHHPDKKNIHKKTFGEMQADLDGRRVRSHPRLHVCSASSVTCMLCSVFPHTIRGSCSEAADFRMVQAAWEVLSDAEKRKEYDGELAFFRQEQAK